MDNKEINLTYEKGEMPTGKVVGYSIGAIGVYGTYYLFTTFFMYFLTEYVHLKPAVAGGVMSFGLFFAAVCDLVVGYVNDRSKNPKGRRRPLMLKAWIPYMVSFALCYVRPGLEGNALIVYYIVVMIVLWLSYACLQVPFYGMIPEVTHNPTDRMRMQEGIALMGNGSNIFISIQPIVFSFMLGLGVDEMAAWVIVMAAFGIIGGFAYMSTWRTTRGMEKPIAEVANPEGSIFQIYAKVLRLKGYLAVVLIYFFTTIFINLNFYSLAYVTEGKFQLSAADTSIVIACYTFSGIILTPLISKMNAWFGSRKSLIIVAIPVLLLNIIFAFTGINNMAMMMIHGFFISSAMVLMTGFIYGLIYQSADYSILHHNEEMEGSMLACATFFYKIGGAISSMVLSVFLTMIGYDGAAVMDPAVMARIDNLLTLFPAILLVVCIVLVVFCYPMSDKLYLRIKTERQKKEAGQPYSTEMLKEIRYGNFKF